jgi:hypothetical protein
LSQSSRRSSRSEDKVSAYSIHADNPKKDLKEPYNWDEYAETFFPKAEELAKIAADAEKAGEKEKASEYYL